MSHLEDLLGELTQYATSKRGAERYWRLSDTPHVRLPCNGWGEFFDVEKDSETGELYAQMPVFHDRFERHRTAYPAIRKSPAVEREGHIYMEVPLDLPVAFLKSLIDESYSIVWNKVDAKAVFFIELRERLYDERALFEDLIDFNDLRAHRSEILGVARPAIMLPTRPSTESEIPIGATKIGGQPDLPPSSRWPAYRDGRPLAFIAQINLAQVAHVGNPIQGLPSTGLLSVFSVWGWVKPGDPTPWIPNDRTASTQEEAGWTVALHTSSLERLERHNTPKSVNSFKAAAAEPTPILSLPHSRLEPPLRALGWTDEAYDRFDTMESQFSRLQINHWFKDQSCDIMAGHQLGGYALFQQEFPIEVLEKQLAMLLQIGSDDNTEMGWDDGGELTFYADARGMAQGRFERLWGTTQGG